MRIDILSWGWPQAALLILLFGHVLLSAIEHGRVPLQSSGPEQGQPRRTSFPVALCRAALVAFLLAAGGFLA